MPKTLTMSPTKRPPPHEGVRIHLFTARHRLASAGAALAERNYGMAETELQKAKEELVKARERSPFDMQSNLSRLEGVLDDLTNTDSQSDPRLKDQVNRLLSDFDAIME